MISREQIWEDSDEEVDYSKVTTDDDFWEILGVNPEQLEQREKELHLKEASQGKQTFRLPAEDVEAFLQYKEEMQRRKLKQHGEASSSSSSSKTKTDDNKVSVKDQHPVPKKESK